MAQRNGTSDVLEAHMKWVCRSLDEMREENRANFDRLAAAFEAHKTANAAEHKTLAAANEATGVRVSSIIASVRVFKVTAGLAISLASFTFAVGAWVYEHLFRG